VRTTPEGKQFSSYLISLYQVFWLNIVHGIQTRCSNKMDPKDTLKQSGLTGREEMKNARKILLGKTFRGIPGSLLVLGK
jgi:hypothetical protein